jgi:hypothetical protein
MEPMSLAALGGFALTEGIKFLYAQAGELIGWWRTHRDDVTLETTEPLPVVEVGAVDSQVHPAVVDRAAMARLDTDIEGLRWELAPYVDDIAPRPIDGESPGLLEVVDGLRQALEAVLGQPIRLVGEARDTSDQVIRGQADVERVAGYVAGVRARGVVGGRIEGRVKSRSVEAGGEAYGVDLGASPPSEIS